MAIIRTKNPINYTVINNVVFEDDNGLSWDAMGLLTYLLSKPADWEISSFALANLKKCGRNKINGLLRELRKASYIVGKKKNDGKYDYYVYDMPQVVDLSPNHENPNQAFPNQAFPNQAFPNQAFPNQAFPNQDLSTQQNTEVNKLLNRQITEVNITPPAENQDLQKSKPVDNSTALLNEFGIIAPDLIADFIQLRKTKRAPITKTALNGIQREANKAQISMTEAITICVERAWASFNADWIGDKHHASTGRTSTTGTGKQSAFEQVAEACGYSTE